MPKLEGHTSFSSLSDIWSDIETRPPPHLWGLQLPWRSFHFVPKSLGVPDWWPRPCAPLAVSFPVSYWGRKMGCPPSRNGSFAGVSALPCQWDCKSGCFPRSASWGKWRNCNIGLFCRYFTHLLDFGVLKSNIVSINKNANYLKQIFKQET